MAIKMYASQDGTTFTTARAADEHDARHELLQRVADISNGTPEVILKWFEENFRVPQKRQPRKPRTPSVPQPSQQPPATSAGAENANPKTK